MEYKKINMPGLLHGGDYNPEQWLDRPDILEEDIRLMKLAHVNNVSLGIFSWAFLEPEEGKYQFDYLEEIINRLYDNGIYTNRLLMGKMSLQIRPKMRALTIYN